MTVNPHTPESANVALGLSEDALNWLSNRPGFRPSSGGECGERHWSQEIRAWENVVGHLSIAATLRASEELVGQYDGHSFWCAADGSDETWTALFAPLHTFLGLPAIEGVECWLRRCSARRGKPFHFDKDEQLFAFAGQIACPLLSTVLYLTHGGPTLISDYHASMDEAAGPSTRLFKAKAEPGKLLAFPGDRCHAVIAEDRPFDRQSLVMNWWPRRPRGVESRSWRITLPELDLERANRVRIECFEGAAFT